MCKPLNSVVLVLLHEYYFSWSTSHELGPMADFVLTRCKLRIATPSTIAVGTRWPYKRFWCLCLIVDDALLLALVGNWTSSVRLPKRWSWRSQSSREPILWRGTAIEVRTKFERETTCATVHQLLRITCYLTKTYCNFELISKLVERYRGSWRCEEFNCYWLTC